MAKASEQMEKALKVSECVPEIGTELHRERLLSKLLDEAVVDGDPQTILLFKGLVRAAGEEDDGEAGTLGECATSGEATAWLQQNWKKGSMLADQICHNVTPAPGLGGSKPKAVSIDTQPQDPAAASGDGQIFGAYGLSARSHIELLLRGCKTMDTLDAHKAAHAAKLQAYHAEDAVSSPDSEDSQGSPRGAPTYTCPILNSEESHHDGMAGGERRGALHGWTGTENAPTQRDRVPRQMGRASGDRGWQMHHPHTTA